uniref:DDT domain-containing protein n=1 Tax=Opuntia streptacantha TaxID=393608 RepID=A0A7C9E9C5_OPUST
MQSHDLMPDSALVSPNPHLVDRPTMDDTVSTPIHSSPGRAETNGDAQKAETSDGPETKPIEGEGRKELGSENISSSKNGKRSSNTNNSNTIVKRERPTRACTARPAKYVDPPVIERRPRPPKREKLEKVEMKEVEEEEEQGEGKEQCSRVVTSLVNAPTPEQMPRWNLRSMWQLASILNFFNVFRRLLNITAEFSAEELESALLTPNCTLGDVHIPLLKAIPPVTRMACGRDTWVTVLCRKLRDWWHWVGEGELPIVANHGVEIEAYRTLDPGVRVVILKALCDIRVEQDDIRSYIENSLKHGVQLSAFRKERIGGDSHGISYWYEDDEVIGHRLYREIRKVERKVEVKKGKAKGSHVLPSITYEWETVATNLDEFLDVSEKLFSSKNRTEASLGKKLKNNMLPEIEKIHKRKERLLKKQQREALLLDNFVTVDGLVAGRSLRDRKPVTYTFDDFDRSINEAIKITKQKQPSTEPTVRREGARSEATADGRWNGSAHASPRMSFSPPSPIDYDEMDEDHKGGPLDPSDRRRQRPQRYSEREFVEGISDHDEDFYSDDDIVGEAVYDEEYLRQRKHRKKMTSSSEGEGDEEYHWSEENGDDEVEEEEDDSLSLSEEDSDKPRGRFEKSESTRARRGAKLKSVDELQAGVRRSKRATRNRINYRKYELSESENESNKSGMADVSERHSRATDDAEYSMESQDSDGNDEEQEKGSDHPTYMDVEKDENQPMTKPESPSQDDTDGIGHRKFLDLNELAPGSGFEDGPSVIMKGDDGGDKHQ